jgi:hypothetical protein
LTKDPRVVASIVGTVGFPEERLWMLAGLELAAAGGLFIGCSGPLSASPPRSASSSTSIGVLVGHLRVRDTAIASIAPPATVLVLGVVALLLRLGTA